MDSSEPYKELEQLLKLENGCEYSDVSDQILDQAATSANNSINILHLNIRSICKNHDQLVMLLKDLCDKGIVVHVIVLCETFLTNSNQALVDIENYTAVHRPRLSERGGGISAYLHDSVKLTKNVVSPFNDSFESLCFVLKWKGKQFCVSEIYRPPNSNDDQFMQSLEDLLMWTKFVFPII